MTEPRPVKLLFEPKVYLIGRTTVAEEGLQTFLSDAALAWPTPTEGVKDAERLIEFAGRCCYMSFGGKAASKTNAAYVNNLLGRTPDGGFRPGPAHGSVTEHPHFTFAVRGGSRGFSHEQVRHRHENYSQLSTRYCNFEQLDVEEGDWEPAFCVPPLAQLSDRSKAHFAKSFAIERQLYVDALQIIEADLKAQPEYMKALENDSPRDRKRKLRKAARGAARELLPIGCEAIMTMSMNPRSIWNNAFLRASEHAEAVIRSIYIQMLKIMEVELPALFHGIEYTPVWDGSVAARMPREKL